MSANEKLAATFHPHPSYTAMEAAWDPERRDQARQEKESRP